MEILVLNIVKIILGIALVSYIFGTFRYFTCEGYSIVNSIAQSFLHLFFCGYTLYGWINLLLNTPRLEQHALAAIGGLWLFSCLLLFFILDYLRSSIPRKRTEETVN